jgi:hypothetical protein
MRLPSLHLGLPAENAPFILFNRSWGMYVCSSPSFFLVLFKIQCFERERERERERECDAITETACPFASEQMHGKIDESAMILFACIFLMSRMNCNFYQ